MLDIGCRADNNSLKLLEQIPSLNCGLVDLSDPMLKRTFGRISEVSEGIIRTFQGDFREVVLPKNRYDIVIAAAVLHHLRDDQDWKKAFSENI